MLGRILTYSLTGCAVIAGIVIIYMAVTVNLEIVMRYFFNKPTTWVTEFSSYSIVWVTFCAAAWVLNKEGHVKIEILLDHLPERTQQLFNITTSVIGILLCSIFFWFSLQVTLTAIEGRQMYVTAMPVPRWPVMIAMPIGAFFLVLQFIRRTWWYLRGEKEPEKAEQIEVL